MTITLEFPAETLLPSGRQADRQCSTLTLTAGIGFSDEYTVTKVHECVLNCASGMRRVFCVTIVSEVLQDTREFICEVAFGRRWFAGLKEEALLYEGNLSPLCGKAIPIYYGFFKGETYEGRTGIMVLEDCGKPLRAPIRRQPLYFRQSLLLSLINVHRAGVDLENFSIHNIVVTHQSSTNKYIPVIIDFSNANAKHKCPYTGQFVTYDLMPYLCDVGCPQLWKAFEEADIFSPRYVTFFDREVPIELAQNVEMLKANGHPPEDVPQSIIDEAAYEAVKAYYDWTVERDAWDEGEVLLQ